MREDELGLITHIKINKSLSILENLAYRQVAKAFITARA
jgi:hypothetical protein